MKDTRLPTHLTCQWYSNNTNWSYAVLDDKSWLDRFVANADANGKVFAWTDEIGNEVVYLVIVNYNYPIVAKINYALLDPSRFYRDSYENFLNPSKNSSFVSLDWKNEISDQEAVQCGTGNRDKCYGWFYRARYAQTYLYIYSHGPNCDNGFEDIVKAINTQFTTFLK
jgi:hypothetical protein